MRCPAHLRAGGPLSSTPPMSTSQTVVSFDLTTEAAAIASQLGLGAREVRGAIDLLANGSTIPFIARYRKEQTGGLDEVQVGSIDDAITTAKELIDHKNRVLKSVFQQNALGPELERAILAARTGRRSTTYICPTRPSGRRGRRSRANVGSNRWQVSSWPRRNSPRAGRRSLRRSLIRPARSRPRRPR